MSGSSPWYVLPGPGNRPIQVMSGATIRDHRSALQAAYVLDPGHRQQRRTTITRIVLGGTRLSRDARSASNAACR